MPKCRACGEEIIFIRAKNGRSMPCNPKEVSYKRQDKGGGKIITPDGEMVSCLYWLGHPGNADGVGYIPHWATCPKADSFRKGAR